MSKKSEPTIASLRADVRKLQKSEAAGLQAIEKLEADLEAANARIAALVEDLEAHGNRALVKQLRRTIHRLTTRKGYTAKD